VEWIVTKDSESYFIFSGGLPQDVTGAQPSITVMQVSTRGSGGSCRSALGARRVMQVTT